MKPKISIIVPVYNVEKYLNKCIDSILNQIFKEFELILVDDGSPDNCGEICDKYRRIDNRIIVIHKENGGVSSARNEGINIANGEFIGFVDPDDYLDEDALDYLYMLAKNNNADIACYKMKTYKEGVLKSKIEINEDIKVYVGEEIIKEYSETAKFLYSSCNKIYSKSIFEGKSNRFSDTVRYAEDALFNYYMISKANILVFSNLQKYNYCINTNGVVSSVTEKRLDILKAQKEIYYFLHKRYNQYTQKITEDYIGSSILIVTDITSESNIIAKSKILKGLKNRIKIDKDILKNIKNISAKKRICFYIVRASPIIFAILYKIKILLSIKLTGKMKHN